MDFPIALMAPGRLVIKTPISEAQLYAKGVSAAATAIKTWATEIIDKTVAK